MPQRFLFGLLVLAAATLPGISEGAQQSAPPAVKVEIPRRIRIGGPRRPIFHPAPQYPPLAKKARIQGTVRLEAIIGTDGTIRELKTLSGHPLLVGAALDAVSRWRYKPTQLNGQPVEVITEIKVHFRLGR